MSEFGVQVIDHLGLLSKNQIVKLKKSLKASFSEKIYHSIDAKIRFNQTLYKEILPSIQYTSDTETKYNHAELTWDAENKLCKIELLFRQNEQSPETKMKRILFEKNMTRKTNHLESEHWKTYVRLKDLTGRQDIPTPNDILKNKTIYEELLKSLPKSPIKSYFEQCLS